MATASERLGRHAKAAAKDVQKMGETARDVAREAFEQAGEMASEYYEQGQETARSLTHACEQFLRQKPLASVLVAACIGWLLDRFWKRG